MRCERVEVALLEREAGAAVLERESEISRDDLGPEAAEDALDEGHGVAVLVDHGQVDRVAVLEGLSRRDVGGRALAIDELAARVRVRLGDEPRGRQLVGVGIRDVGVAVRPDQLLRLGVEVDGLGGVVSECGDVVALHDVQDHQGEDAGAVRRDLPDVVAAVVRADRLDPGRRVVLEVGLGEVAAVGLAEGDDPAGDVALVERVPASLRDRLVGGGEPRVPEHLPDARRAAVRQVGGGRVGPLRQREGRARPLTLDDLAHGEAVARVGDGRGEDLGQLHRPEALQQLVPGVDRAGHRPRERAVARHPVVALPNQRLAADLVRRNGPSRSGRRGVPTPRPRRARTGRPLPRSYAARPGRASR